jgi:hypothetical protein
MSISGLMPHDEVDRFLVACGIYLKRADIELDKVPRTKVEDSRKAKYDEVVETMKRLRDDLEELRTGRPSPNRPAAPKLVDVSDLDARRRDPKD